MKKIIGFILKLLLIAIVLFILYYGYVGWAMYKDATKDIPIEEKVESVRKMEHYVKLEDVPDYYWQAVIAVEDKRFFNHGAIDLFSTIGAIFENIVNNEFSTGGSSITQQLAKNLFFSQEKRLKRKVAELFAAEKLEKMYTKEEILELYLNVIYYGDGYYGLYDAAKGYFNKEPKDLTLYESTLLAGIPNAPSVYSLSTGNTYIYTRQKIILDCMVEQGYITKEEAKYVFEKQGS